MKNSNIYIIVIVFIILISFFIYSNISKASDSDLSIQNKALSEVQYFESKIIYMFNSLNNIEFDNYKISSQDITEKAKKSAESSSSAGSGEGDASGEKSSSSNDSANKSPNERVKKYSLESKGVLTNNEQINWDNIKKEAEILQSSIATMILDLYEIGVNSNEILSFNKEYDKLLVEIKNENIESTLYELSLLYQYIPKFISECNTDEQYRIVINTKVNILNAYSILDSEEWTKIYNYIKIANEEFSRLLTDINLKSKNQYTTNKCYILINGLLDSIETKDKEIFLIKYRNLMEELNNM